MSRYDDIIAWYLALLATIEVANGYNTDGGFQVYLNLEYQEHPKDFPTTILLPGDVNDSLSGDTPAGAGEENHFLPLVIEGWIKDNAKGEQGQLLRQDYLRAIKADQFANGLTEGFDGNVSSSVEQVDGGEEGLLSFVKIEFSIFYVTAWGSE